MSIGPENNAAAGGGHRFDVICVGEGMLEISCGASSAMLGYGGDALNTAIHLARSGVRTAMFSALGGDSFSADLRAKWVAEGLDCSMVLTHPRRSVGLYAIRTDAEGERTFEYWRDSSAAREMFDLPGTAGAAATARHCRILFFSLITLAILSPNGRERLFRLADAVRAGGGLVAFDGNYRSRLWPSPQAARDARDAALSHCDIGFPTFEDERALGCEDAPSCARHWRDLGCGEPVVKLGADGCLLPAGDVLPIPERLRPLDTSGAGDAFNAAYLAARLRGATPEGCAAAGHALAGAVITRAGAVPPLETEIYAAATMTA